MEKAKSAFSVSDLSAPEAKMEVPNEKSLID